MGRFYFETMNNVNSIAPFASVIAAPADPILGLTDAFKADPRPEKINLGVGVFVSEEGTTPLLTSVRQAEERLARAAKSKSYLPITGSAAYAELTRDLALGSSLAAESKPRFVTAQTPGGTGALRVAADFLAGNLSNPTVWISTPTWANHKGIFQAAGLTTEGYPYFDATVNGVNFEAMIDVLQKIPAGDVVVLHACCHNPTGADLTGEQWRKVAEIAADRGWLPFLDFAYQGFGDGLEADSAGLRVIVEAGLPCLVAQSFSKNFGLYQDRVGALHILTESADAAGRVASQVKIAIRTNYSNPPAHGGAIVETILSDESLKALWATEVEAMRDRINGVRSGFVRALSEAGVGRDFSFLQEQRGMFSFTGIPKEQVHALRDAHGIYMVDSGRVNVAGITSANMPRLVGALKTVLG